MLVKFLTIFYIILCIIIGYGEWYLIMWFITKQSNPLEWSLFTKIMYLLFAMTWVESIRNTEIKITFKRKNDE
jgi:hypothetical protein